MPQEGLSDAAVFPGAAYAPYAGRSYVWNPPGSGVARRRVDVPVMLLEGDAALDAARRASGNAIQVLVHSWYISQASKFVRPKRFVGIAH